MKDIYKEITELGIDNNVVNTLKENKINSIYDLCTYSRKDLSKIGMENAQINKVVIELQLLGLDLRPNLSQKNSLLEKYMKIK